MNDELKRIAQAKPTDEPDRAKIKWRKLNWKIPRGRTTPQVYHNRPSPEVYWNIVKQSGKNIHICELCQSDFKITIHHRDGNPFNNDLSNLQILCWSCHQIYHDPTEEGVHDYREGTRVDLDILDDPEIRKFFGIIDEDEGVLDE